MNIEDLDSEQIKELNQVYGEIFSALQTLGKKVADQIAEIKFTELQNKWLTTLN